MSETPPESKRTAWQPLSFGGVAAFAHASLSRLLVVELVVASIVAVSVVSFIAQNYSPVILAAIQKLPENAALENGALTNLSSQVLAETKFFSIAVDLDETGQLGQSAEIQVELCRSNFQICSLLRSVLGHLDIDYPSDPVTLGRSQVEPWWGAWEPMILLGVGIIVVVLLFVFWALLAVFYLPPIKLIAYFADRDLSWGASWRLAAAALLPGALFMALTIVLYSAGVFDLLALAFFWGAHLIMGWGYVVASPWFAPRLPAAQSPRINPFTSKKKLS